MRDNEQAERTMGLKRSGAFENGLGLGPGEMSKKNERGDSLRLRC